jgi:hypothetical protein
MSDQVGKANNQHALLIGIDCYLPGQLPGGIYYPNLRGCVRDIAHVTDFLKSRLNLADNHILRLTASFTGAPEPSEPRDRWPTYENMVAAFKQLTETVQAGDHVYVHYSGHGGRTKTLVPEIKGPDGLDEALVPTDIHSSEARYLRDIELAVICQHIVKRGIRLSVVLDSCHSGGAVRGVGDVAVRGIGRIDTTPRPEESLVASPHELAETWSNLTRSGTRNVSLASGWLPEPEGYVLLAACRPTESAYEYAFSGSERNGALTYWLLDAIANRGPGLSAKTLHERILAKVHSQFEQQTPQLQGEGQSSLFGFDVAAAPATATVLEVDNTNRRVRLTSAGQAFGNRKGAQFAIYSYGATNFSDASKRLAIAAVTEVGATDSWATITIVLSDAPIEQGAPAVLLDQGSLKLLCKIALVRRHDLPTVTNQDAALDAIGKAMTGNPWVTLKTPADGDTLEYQVVVNEKRQFKIWDPAGQPIANLRPPIGIDDPNAIATVVSRLEHLAKYNAVKQLDNHDPQSPLARKLVVELVGYQEDYTPGDKPAPRAFEVPGNTPIVSTGQWIFLRIRNNADRSLNVTVLDLQPDWGISQVFPAGQGDWFVQLEPGREQLLNLKASLPAGYEQGLDVLKVFAAVGAANFGRLELPALDAPATGGAGKRASATRGQPNPLEDLMDAISGDKPPAFATRTFTSGAYPSAEWTTSLVEVHVRRL